MKKLIFLVLMIAAFAGQSQITKTQNIATMGATYSYYFAPSSVSYSYPLGQTVHFAGITGTGGGELYFLASPVDSLKIVLDGPYIVNSDTTFSIYGEGTPFEYNGFMFIKNGVTGGNATMYLSRKTSK